jgi:hypothetical protein
MELVTYIRKQPWRPRGSWLGARAGARRRGFRQDELASVADASHDGVDVVMSVHEVALDDTMPRETTLEPAARSVIPARVDLSGLQAIAALAPRRFSSSPEGGAAPAVDWRAYEDRGDEDRYLTRHSA